jgi:hypothetical protein
MFSNITVVNVDGRIGDNLSTQMALIYSQSKLPGSKSLLIAPQEPKITIGNFDFAKIDPLDYSAYSIFMLYKLHNFINTEFALVIQDDGWVINEKAWSKNYFSYDYLGAPTHLARRKLGELYSYYKNYTWVKDYCISPENFDVVLNGGFSLRSKKLLELPEAKSMKFIIDPPDPKIKSSLAWSQDPLLEDVQICLQLRTQLEAYGIKFPKIEIAKKFSIEHIDLNFHDKLDLMDVFGHHSKLRKICSLNPITIEYQISEENIYKLPGEIYIYQMFKKLGYRIKFSA